MIEALIAGHLRGVPTLRTTAFNASAIESVQRITDGDSRVP
jgi:hypothetical protein